ncbi:hypothetical protein K523DRAFT_257135, partial [Schizophyllum commune Tattone D]
MSDCDQWQDSANGFWFSGAGHEYRGTTECRTTPDCGPITLNTFLEQVPTNAQACLLSERDEARRQTGILHRANVERLEAQRERAHSPLAVNMCGVHCASPTSALHPLQKDQEVDVPDARALLPPRRPRDKRGGGNVLIVRAEKPSRASSPNHAEVSEASTTACTSYSDATPEPGGRIGLTVTDGGCGMGYALGFYDDPRG